MVYRPTVRYADIFLDYVDSVFHATTLDRNQIIRGALFSAALSVEFHKLLESYKKKDVPLPSPLWSLDQHEIWLEQCPGIKGRGKHVNVNDKRTVEVRPKEKQERKDPAKSRILNKGGITIRIG